MTAPSETAPRCLLCHFPSGVEAAYVIESALRADR